MKRLAMMMIVMMTLAGPLLADKCAKCKDMMVVGAMGKCTACKADVSSSAYKLCKACSAKQGKCEMCLVAMSAKKPATPATPDPKAVAAKKAAAAKEALAKLAAKTAVKNALDVHAMMVKEKKTPAPATPGCPTMAELTKAGLIDDLTAGQWQIEYKKGKLADVIRPAGAAGTPKGTLANLAEAMKAGDTKRLAACFAGTAEEKKTIVMQLETMCLMYKFSEAMEKEYGKEALKRGMMGDVKDALKQLQTARVETEGDTAKVFMTREGRPERERPEMTMTKTNGLWYIENPMKEQGRQMPKQMIEQQEKMIKAMKAAVAGIMPEIGKEGVTAEEINKKLKAAMEAAMKEMMGGAMEGAMIEDKPAPAPAQKSAPKTEGITEVK